MISNADLDRPLAPKHAEEHSYTLFRAHVRANTPATPLN